MVDRRPAGPRPCSWCGSLIPDRSGPGRPLTYCSQRCLVEARSLRRRTARAAAPRRHDPRPCSNCGRAFTPTRAGTLYCSAACKARAYKRRHPEIVAAETRRYRERYGNPPYSEARRAADARRRALKRSARVEAFTRQDIADRDGWLCGLCCSAIDPGLEWPHPMSPSVDHVVPLALGGEHSMANTQLAHLTCNTRKGVKASGEQLRLA